MRWLIFVYLALAKASSSMTYDELIDRAEALAGQPFTPKEAALPQWMLDLDYKAYRTINFKREKMVWGGESQFAIEFFHPGYLFRTPVTVTLGGEEKRFDPEDFRYEAGRSEVTEGEKELHLSGLRVLSKFGGEEWREVLILQGASYWRATGSENLLGLSARGAALETGELKSEEFPSFTEIHVEEPEPDSQTLTLSLLMESESLTGAFKLKLTPGKETLVQVESTLFARKDLRRVGIAAMSSMFWYSPAFPWEFRDWGRPSVHDSDGLVVHTKDGERLWKPLTNQRRTIEFSVLDGTDSRGFGLLQRKQNQESFGDPVALYEKRTSLYIEPMEPWGNGQIVLVELPTDSEYVDNIALMWEPQGGIKAGERRAFRYTQRWTSATNPADAPGQIRCVSLKRNEKGASLVLGCTPFNPTFLQQIENLYMEVSGVSGDVSRTFSVPITQRSETGELSASIQLEHLAAEDSFKPTEWRCSLKRPDHTAITETWLYTLHR